MDRTRYVVIGQRVMKRVVQKSTDLIFYEIDLKYEILPMMDPLLSTGATAEVILCLIVWINYFCNDDIMVIRITRNGNTTNIIPVA